MKKLFIFSLIILAVSAGWHFRFDIKNLLKSSPQLTNLVHESVILDTIRKEVFAPPPLRIANGDFSKTNLTGNGVVKWTNTQRQVYNLPPLRQNSRLDQAAQKKLEDMFASQYFDHVSPTGAGPADLVREARYEFIAIGENLALGNFRTDEALVQAWMDSPGHRENILHERFQEIGVAVGPGTFQGKKVWIAVQEFAKPASACPTVNGQSKNEIEDRRGTLNQLEARLQEEQEALATSRPKTPDEYDAYHQKVANYNARVRDYNTRLQELKSIINRYNSQVKAFNECIGT